MNTAPYIALPLIAGFFASLAFRKKSFLIAIIASVSSLLLSLISLIRGGSSTYTIKWFSISGIDIDLAMRFDNLSLILACLVSFISVMVFIYSNGYMKQDRERFFMLLMLFASSMLMVVLSANFIQLYVFWVLLGISSYLLIGFWHMKELAAKAARKAIVIISIGDTFLLSGIIMLFLQYGTFDFGHLTRLAVPNAMTVLSLIFIFIGAATKSAIFPFHGWLADAMQGPTPVSAFLHSATMVKAGLFLLIRLMPMYSMANLTGLILAASIATISFGALYACFEKDIKRILAYSTISQLGFILFAISLGGSNHAFLHIINHAFFKALLFMFAGIAIYEAGTQDITQMKRRFSSSIDVLAAIGILSLAGLMPLSGFWGKEAIFSLTEGNTMLFAFFLLASILSAIYSFRLLFIVYSGKNKGYKAEQSMKIPVFILGILSAASGVLISSLLGFGFHLDLAIYSTLALILGAFIAAYIREDSREKDGIDNLYSLFSKVFLVLSNALIVLDRMLDFFIDQIAAACSQIASRSRAMCPGRMNFYITMIALGFIALLALLVISI